MRSAIKLILITAGVFLPISHSIANKMINDPIELYSNEIHFDVFRKGEKVGYHRVKFSKDVSGLNVQIVFEIEIDFLFFTAYQFKYHSESRWVEGQLNYLKASVNDDGDKFEVTANRHDQLIRVMSSNETFSTPAPILPTNHWNASVLNHTRVLNTLTGRVNTVSIAAQGIEPVATENGHIEATRYVYTGDLDNEVWYDQAGRWVKMRFKASDGSIINYVCKRCQGKALVKAFQ